MAAHRSTAPSPPAKDTQLNAVLAHNRDEEKEHASMLLEWIRHAERDPLLLADAHRLPVRDGAVDVAVLITTLEFLECPGLALQESSRAAECGLALVVLNQWSLGAASRRWGRQSRGALLADAHDLSLPRLRQEIRKAAGGRLRHLHWRTALLPRPFDRVLAPVPCGDVIGVAAEFRSAAAADSSRVPRPSALARSEFFEELILPDPP